MRTARVHLRQLVRGADLLLPVSGNILLVALVILYKLHRLHKHAAGAAARIVNLAGVRLDHFGYGVDVIYGVNERRQFANVNPDPRKVVVG